MSSNFDFIVEKYSKFLNIKRFFSVKLEVKNNFFTGKILGNIPYGKNKLNIIKKFYNDEILKNAIAYGDDKSDRFILDYVGRSIYIE